MPDNMANGPSVQLSFANNFWGKEDAGVHPLLQRMQNAKVTCDELKIFYTTRAAIEDEYARKMTALCRKPLGSSETGTLRASLDVMRGEVECMGKAHQGIANQMKNELEEPLAAFSGAMKERRKIVQGGIEKLFKTKQQQTQSVNKSRDRYEQDCLKIKGYLAQGHMVMGQEERKNKAKMEKTQIQLASTSNEYESAIKALEETTGRWNRDWKAACDKFQDLEEERLDFTKSSLWTFANIASTVCVSDDASCEKIRLALENCEVEKDISGFIQDSGTGQEIPDPPRYINFCRGDINDTASEASEDGDYSVAQFPRAINPAFRSSSPQPSTFESHHDSSSDLVAPHRGYLETNTPPSRDRTLTPQTANAKPFLAVETGQESQVTPTNKQKTHQISAVPHNEYPTDGMTMFCRTGPPSERSSVVSPARPSSRDSHSEYSVPTSQSSQEYGSGTQSPVKYEPGSTSQGSPSKGLQKRRSGFFSNSPFRRKSKHEKAAPAINSTANHGDWGSGSSRYKGQTQTSPVRPYGASPNGTESPEPVDPRANFQLNVGSNIFDVASPDAKPTKTGRKGLNSPIKDLDPIAAALEELKGVNKQSSVRMSADRYAGVATPGPPSLASNNSDMSAGKRGTPPPSYHDQPMSRLGAPQPAFTSAQMQQTTRKYVNQNQDMYGSERPVMRGHQSDVPRAISPRPMRSTSPRPEYHGRENTGLPRSASPNPYGGGNHRATKSSPSKPAYPQHHSPDDIGRRSPQPSFAKQDRPHSSGNMAIQLSHGDARTQRDRQAGHGRPVSQYAAHSHQQSHHGLDSGGESRARSKSAAGGSRMTANGLPILQYARALYMYRAAIPEELSFTKGDVLAVTRYQDDGWWEAEATNRQGRPGLVPSNYLQPC